MLKSFNNYLTFRVTRVKSAYISHVCSLNKILRLPTILITGTAIASC